MSSLGALCRAYDKIAWGSLEAPWKLLGLLGAMGHLLSKSSEEEANLSTPGYGLEFGPGCGKQHSGHVVLIPCPDTDSRTQPKLARAPLKLTRRIQGPGTSSLVVPATGRINCQWNHGITGSANKPLPRANNTELIRSWLVAVVPRCPKTPFRLFRLLEHTWSLAFNNSEHARSNSPHSPTRDGICKGCYFRG